MTDDADGSTPAVLDGAVELGAFMTTCLGPAGQRKLFVFDDGYVVTDDVHRVFDEIELADPTARFVARHVVAQKEDVGDGSLTVLVLAGALVREARDLLDAGLRRATIADGYERAREAAVAALDRQQRAVPEERRAAALRAVARTALNSSDPSLADVVTDAAGQIDAERRGRNRTLDLSDVHVRTSDRGNGSRVDLVRGVVLDHDVVQEGMARRIENPRIAVIGGGKKAGSGVEERTLFRSGGNEGEGRTEVSFSATESGDLAEFREAELDRVRDQVRRLSEAGVDAVFCSMGISDAGKRLLNDAGITAFRALTENNAAFLARATGATVVMDITDMTADAVGTAGELVVDTRPEQPTVTVSGCETGGVVTLVLTGTLGEYAAERERDLRAAIAVVLDAMDGGQLVPGGGGSETRLAAAVRERARGTDDRTALAMEAYADALEAVPRALARNAGADELETLTTLRGQENAAFDADGPGVREAYPDGPLTTARIVRTAVEGASHVAGRLLRIDDVLEGGEDDDWITAEEIDPTPVPERDFDY